MRQIGATQKSAVPYWSSNTPSSCSTLSKLLPSPCDCIHSLKFQLHTLPTQPKAFELAHAICPRNEFADAAVSFLVSIASWTPSRILEIVVVFGEYSTNSSDAAVPS